MNIRFPVVPQNIPATGFLNLLIAQLTRTFADVVSKNEETPRIVLRSPNGTLYDITISDVGTIIINPTSKTRA